MKEDEELYMDDLIEVFNKCILMRTNTTSDSPYPHLQDIADIVSLGRYIRWSLSCRKIAEIILSRQQKGNIHGHITWNDVLLLSEPFILNKDSYLQVIHTIGHPNKQALLLTNNSNNNNLHDVVSPERKTKMGSSNFSRYVQNYHEDSHYDMDNNNNSNNSSSNYNRHSSSANSNEDGIKVSDKVATSESGNNKTMDNRDSNNSNLRHFDSEPSAYDDQSFHNRSTATPKTSSNVFNDNNNNNNTVLKTPPPSRHHHNHQVISSEPRITFASDIVDSSKTNNNNNKKISDINANNKINIPKANMTANNNNNNNNNNTNTVEEEVEKGEEEVINEDSLVEIDLNDGSSKKNNNNNQQQSQQSFRPSTSSPLPPLKPVRAASASSSNSNNNNNNSRSSSPSHSVHSLHSYSFSSSESPSKQQQKRQQRDKDSKTNNTTSASSSTVGGRLGSFIKSVMGSSSNHNNNNHNSNSTDDNNRSRSQSLSAPLPHTQVDVQQPQQQHHQKQEVGVGVSQSAPVTPMRSSSGSGVSSANNNNNNNTGNTDNVNNSATTASTHLLPNLTINTTAANNNTDTTTSSVAAATDFSSLSPTQKQRLISLSHIRDNTHVLQHTQSRSQNNSPIHAAQQQQQNFGGSLSPSSTSPTTNIKNMNKDNITGNNSSTISATIDIQSPSSPHQLLLPKTDCNNWNDDAVVNLPTNDCNNKNNNMNTITSNNKNNTTNSNTTTTTTNNNNNNNNNNNSNTIIVARHMSDPVIYNNTANTSNTSSTVLPLKPPKKPFMSRSVSDLTSRPGNININNNSVNTTLNSSNLDQHHQQQSSSLHQSLPHGLTSSNTINNNNNNNNNNNANFTNNITCARSESNISFSSVGSHRSVARSVGSVHSEKSTRSYLSNVSSKIIRLFGGGKHPVRHLSSSLDSYNPSSTQLQTSNPSNTAINNNFDNNATVTADGIASPIKRRMSATIKAAGEDGNNNDNNNSFYGHQSEMSFDGGNGGGVSVYGDGKNTTIANKRLRKDGRGIGRVVRQEVARVLRLNHLLLAAEHQKDNEPSSSSQLSATTTSTTIDATSTEPLSSQSLSPYHRLQAAMLRVKQSSVLHLSSSDAAEDDDDDDDDDDVSVSVTTLNHNQYHYGNRKKVSDDVLTLINEIQQHLNTKDKNKINTDNITNNKENQNINNINNNNNNNNNNENYNNNNTKSTDVLIPGSWSYYYHRSDVPPLCLSANAIHNRRQQLLFNNIKIKQIIPSRHQYNHLLLQQKQPQPHKSSTNNNNNTQPSSYFRGGLTLPPIYSTLCSTATSATGVSGLSSIEPYGKHTIGLQHSLSSLSTAATALQSSSLLTSSTQLPQSSSTSLSLMAQQTEYDVAAGVAYHSVVMRKTSHGRFTQRNLVLYNTNVSINNTHIPHLPPRLCVYTSSLPSAWGQLPVGLKSCVLVSDILAVSVEDPKPLLMSMAFSSGGSGGGNNRRNLFLVLASTYLRPPILDTTIGGDKNNIEDSFVVSKGVVNDEDDDIDLHNTSTVDHIDKSMMSSASNLDATAATNNTNKNATTAQQQQQSQSIHLLLSTDTAEKRLVWVQWLQMARDYISSNNSIAT